MTRAKFFVLTLLAVLSTFALPSESEGVMHPRQGRFLQRDPLGYPDGLNGYAAYHVMRGGVDPLGDETAKPETLFNAGIGGNSGGTGWGSLRGPSGAFSKSLVTPSPSPALPASPPPSMGTINQGGAAGGGGAPATDITQANGPTGGAVSAFTQPKQNIAQSGTPPPSPQPSPKVSPATVGVPGQNAQWAEAAKLQAFIEKVGLEGAEAQETRRSCCKFKRVPPTGNNQAHRAMQARIQGGVPTELLVTTPSGDFARFDAGLPYDRPTTVYEVKTGNEWTRNPNPPPAWLDDRAAQFANESKVAAECGLQFIILVQTERVAEGMRSKFPDYQIRSE